MSVLVVVDIDGTITSCGHRFAEAGPEPTRDNKEVYEAWVAKVQNEFSLRDDPAVPGMAAFVAALRKGGADVVLLTSREERWRGVTRWWLLNNYFDDDKALFLYMRPNGDYREGADFKESAICQIIANHTPSSVIVIDDDGQGTIEPMCKKNGWTFLKARSGGQL